VNRDVLRLVAGAAGLLLALLLVWLELMVVAKSFS